MVPNAPMRVALIGLGAVGQSVVQLLSQHAAADVIVVGALVRDLSRTRSSEIPSIVSTVDALLATKPEVVVEAGGHVALRAYGPAILRAHCDLVVVSIGALAERNLEEEIIGAAKAGDAQAKVVSGAIGGLDALAAAALGGLTCVTHTTCKPASTLLSGVDVRKLTGAVEVFQGTAREGALKYPESVNVAAAVSLAGIGFDRTRVRVVADPFIDRNHHQVTAEGTFGTLHFDIKNIPSNENARTAKLVAMSAARAVLLRRAPLIVG
jgi:aspartate dehydrogenase